MKSCIAVLTRGYSNLSEYNKLIKRNRHIVNNLNNKSIDILIFHEGNINEEQQLYIQNQTPEINLIFTNILNNAFKKEKESIQPETPVGNWYIGYKHMCSFWFLDFWKCVQEYDFLLRIDEDCFINCNVDNILSKLHACNFVCGKVTPDTEEAVVGLNDFTLDFVNKNKRDFHFKNFNNRVVDGPYTNLIGISLNRVRENELFCKYAKEIDGSEMIYKRRWGDLPLWGEVIYYIFGDDTLIIDPDIKYFHESHRIGVNQ